MTNGRKARASRQLFDWFGEKTVKRDMRIRVDRARSFDQIIAASQVNLPEGGPVRHRRGRQR